MGFKTKDEICVCGCEGQCVCGADWSGGELGREQWWPMNRGGGYVQGVDWTIGWVVLQRLFLFGCDSNGTISAPFVVGWEEQIAQYRVGEIA